ncbi:MAG: hypothetical protein ACYSTY_04720, partial [Planctomycetota bacterium]
MIALALGAIINIGVAWGCALVSLRTPSVTEEAHKAVPSQVVMGAWCAPRSLKRPGVHRILFEAFDWAPGEPFSDPDGRLRDLVPGWAFEAAMRYIPDLESYESVLLDARGWPFVSLMSETLPLSDSLAHGWAL